MTETVDERFEDPTTAPFWEGACHRRLLIQQCEKCRSFQFYPRPFCLQCQSDSMCWTGASGYATVYSQTINHIAVRDDLRPPYVVAIVELDEGPRLVTNIIGGPTVIGQRVCVDWRERQEGPPIPVFRPLGDRPGAGTDALVAFDADSREGF